MISKGGCNPPLNSTLDCQLLTRLTRAERRSQSLTICSSPHPSFLINLPSLNEQKAAAKPKKATPVAKKAAKVGLHLIASLAHTAHCARFAWHRCRHHHCVNRSATFSHSLQHRAAVFPARRFLSFAFARERICA